MEKLPDEPENDQHPDGTSNPDGEDVRHVADGDPAETRQPPPDYVPV